METGWDGSECWANKMAGNVVDNCSVFRWAVVGVVGTRLVPCLLEDSRPPPAQTNLLLWTNGGSLQVLGIQWVNVAEVGAG